MGTLNLGEVEISRRLIKKACILSMKAHKSPREQYLSEKICNSSIIFSFPGSWFVNDWFTTVPFGETKVDLQLFPSLRYIGLDRAATCNEAFLKRFKAVLANLRFKNEVRKAVTEKKKVVFTGHSSGGAIAILATIWFLEMYTRQTFNDVAPLCLTFGSPLVGDHIMSHALRRERWSRYFVNFITRHDIVPRVSLTPLPSIEQQLQQVLSFFNPKSKSYKQEPAAIEAPSFYVTVMVSVASCAASDIMGSTNLFSQTLTSFIELSPYRPSGTHVFCTENRKLVVIGNPDAFMQVLFFSSQLSTMEEKVTVAQTSLRDHLNYRGNLQKYLHTQIVPCLRHGHLEALPLSLDDADTALNGLGLSERARLCIDAAEELEKQKRRNQAEMDEKKKDIEKSIMKLEAYKCRCELGKECYYDVFKISKGKEDFHANVERLELAGIWDEIVGMLKKNELPDEFEGQKAWIDLGTRYRRIAEPLDIANFYRHVKNEDTGPYMGKGRPKRYKCTQRWREHAHRNEMKMASDCELIPESCFWAEVEELCIKSGNPGIEESISHLKTKVEKWIQDGELGEDVYFENSSFKKLLQRHSLPLPI